MDKKRFMGQGEPSKEIPEKLFGEFVRRIVDLVDYTHREKIELVVAPEARARETGVMFREFYKRRYPRERVPKVYFVNVWDLDTQVNFEKTFPKLAKGLKNKKCMIMDTCIHAGKTMKVAHEILKKFGGDNKIYRAVISSSHEPGERYKPHGLDFEKRFSVDVHAPPFFSGVFKKSCLSDSPGGELDLPPNLPREQKEIIKKEHFQKIRISRQQIKSWADQIIPKIAVKRNSNKPRGRH